MAMDYNTSTTAGTYGGSTTNRRRVLSASTLEGDRVVNAAGEDLGKMQDIMIDVQSGRVAYAVLSFGGFLGIGDKLFAIPWNRLFVDEENKQLVLDVDRQTLEQAPGFDKDNWPDMSDPSWGAQLHSYYGSRPYWDDTISSTTETTGVRRTGSTML
ncbi:MAG: PRC-barrel domain-containing protein [Bryobacterales bacterium]|nr:PRC-barrel domain-containing protein [Bryobacterales bacterium]